MGKEWERGRGADALTVGRNRREMHWGGIPKDQVYNQSLSRQEFQ